MEKTKEDWTLEILTTLLVVVAAVVVMSAQFGYGAQIGPNYRNVTVDTTVNITNSLPEILAVIVDSPITLTAGSTKSVEVNITIRDFQGYADIATVNGTFFDDIAAGPLSADDNNDHYTNSSCSLVNGNGDYANYTCVFNLWYYANPTANWTTNVTAYDQAGAEGNDGTNATVQTLLAINVTDLIDFGNLAVGDVNDPTVQANVTNFGNALINVSLYGYGNTTGDGLAMVCDIRNISIEFERFSVNITEPYATMNQMAASPQLIPNWQLVQRTVDGGGGEIVNSTYWRIQIPIATNPAGRCNGSIVFQAESS